MYLAGDRRIMDGMEESRETWRLGHRPALDGVRGVAILLVLAFHSINHGSSGVVGVTLFFSLSGFLITANLLNGTSLRRFYARRARRLFPALAVLCAVLVTLGLVKAWQVGAVAIYSANWVVIARGQNIGLLQHTWSLAVEEQFYLLWPLIVILTMRRTRLLLSICLVGAICSAVARLAFSSHDGEAGFIRAYFGLDTRADALLLGAGLAVALHGSVMTERRSISPIWGWAACVALGIACLAPWESGLAASASIASVAGVVLVYVSLVQPARLLTWAPLVAIGKVSYGLYLWHYPIFEVVHQNINGPRVVEVLLSWTLSLAAASASWVLVERPWLRSGVVRQAPVRLERRGNAPALEVAERKVG